MMEVVEIEPSIRTDAKQVIGYTGTLYSLESPDTRGTGTKLAQKRGKLSLGSSRSADIEFLLPSGRLR